MPQCFTLLYAKTGLKGTEEPPFRRIQYKWLEDATNFRKIKLIKL
jgi:hypothetical protein